MGMAPREQKKSFDNSLLCGLRSDAPTLRKPSLPTKHEDVQEPDASTFVITPSPRPQSLTLPFQNRERASHLITDEELEAIMRREELGPVPRMLSALPRHFSGLGIRRSASTAKAAGLAVPAPRPRPVSVNFGNTNQTFTHTVRSGTSHPALFRDPTLTALPRPPTKNNMAIYPSDSSFYPQSSSPGSAALCMPTELPGSEVSVQQPELSTFFSKHNTQRGHKRQFSLSLAAASMVESVKKRIKQSSPPGSPDMHVSGPSMSPSQTRRGTHRSRPSNTSYILPPTPIIHANDYHNPMTTPSIPSTHETTTTTSKSTRPSPSQLKPFLKQTWTTTKHSARKSIHTLTSTRHQTKPPLYECRRTSTGFMVTDTILDPTGPSISKPLPPSPRPQPWQVVPMDILGDEIERLENRTRELLCRENGYEREIRYLRARVGVLEGIARPGMMGRAAAGPLAGRCTGDTNRHSSDTEVNGDTDMDMAMATNMNTKMDRNTDKRKTWMTCTSDEDSDSNLDTD